MTAFTGRREFITLVGRAVAAWPLAAHAQQQGMSVIGLLRSTPSAPFAHFDTAVRQGLNEIGFVEGQNVTIDTAMQTISMIGYLRSRAIWSAAKWP